MHGKSFAMGAATSIETDARLARSQENIASDAEKLTDTGYFFDAITSLAFGWKANRFIVSLASLTREVW